MLANWSTFSFYILEALLFCFFIGALFFYLGSTLAFDWKGMGYFWSIMWLMSGVWLVLTFVMAACHVHSFSTLVFKYRRHLKRAKVEVADF